MLHTQRSTEQVSNNSQAASTSLCPLADTSHTFRTVMGDDEDDFEHVSSPEDDDVVSAVEKALGGSR